MLSVSNFSKTILWKMKNTICEVSGKIYHLVRYFDLFRNASWNFRKYHKISKLAKSGQLLQSNGEIWKWNNKIAKRVWPIQLFIDFLIRSGAFVKSCALCIAWALCAASQVFVFWSCAVLTRTLRAECPLHLLGIMPRITGSHLLNQMLPEQRAMCTSFIFFISASLPGWCFAEVFFVVFRLDSKGAISANVCRSCRSRQELSNEGLLAKSVSILPRTSLSKFAKN